MSLNNARIGITSYLINNWTDTELVFKGPGAKQRGDYLFTQHAPWIYNYIHWGAEVQKSAPAPKAKFVQQGLVASKIWARADDGEGRLFEVVDKYRDLLRNKKLTDGVELTSNHIGVHQNDDDQIWHCVIISTKIRVYYEKQILPA